MSRHERGRQRLRHAAWLALLLIAALVATPSSVLAHANLDRADPAPGSSLATPPAQIRAVFSEPVDPSFSRLQVLDARRQVVDRGDSHVAPDDPRVLILSLPPNLPDGLYTVAWRTLSAVDGHSVDGAFAFVVGTVPDGTAVVAAPSSEAQFAPETAVSRWWLFVAASLLFGTLLAWRYAFAGLPPRPRRGARGLAPHLTIPARRARRLALLGGLALVVGTLYGAVAQAASASGLPIWGALGQPLAEVLSRGRFATIWWPRLALAVLAAVLVAWRGVHGRVALVALVATAGVLLTSSLTSHGAALSSGPYLAVAADWLHFLGAAAWVGGLACVVAVLPPILRGSAPAPRQALGHVLRRFSDIALVSVLVIAVTGTFQAWVQVGAWDGLWQTTYGLDVLVKIVLMALMVAFGAYHLLVLRPRLRPSPAPAVATADPTNGDAEVSAAAETMRLGQRFRLLVGVELTLGVFVLLAAAVLTGLSPGREDLARASGETSQAGPVDRRLNAQGLNAVVRITPNTVGLNRLAVDLPGTDPAQVERVQLNLTYLDSELGSQPVVLQPAASAPGTWEASTPDLSQPGQWQAELLVRRTGQDDARSAFRFAVAGPGVSTDQPTLTASYPLLPSVGVALAGVLAVAGAAAALAGLFGGLGRRTPQARIALVAAGLLVVSGGGYVYAKEQQDGMPLDVANVRDPVPPDERSLANGQSIYQTNCAVCHGDTGRGDGPGGLRLVPRPADLRVHMAAGHTDGQLFYWVSFGVQGTAMPAWGGTLSEQQRWDVINYIRTFANQNNGG